MKLSYYYIIIFLFIILLYLYSIMGYCDREVKAINHLNYFCSRALIFQLIGTFELQNFSELEKKRLLYLFCFVR